MSNDWTHLSENYRGRWVALADDEATVLASGASARDALQDAIHGGHPHPILFRVPDSLEAFAGHEV